MVKFNCSYSQIKVLKQCILQNNTFLPGPVSKLMIKGCSTVVSPAFKRTTKKSRVFKTKTIETYDQTEYYFEDGLRKVYPYYFTFQSYCKESWIGQKLLDVMSQFPPHSKKEYEKKINSGLLTVNNEASSCNYILTSNDVIKHTVHRHELPVIGTKSIKILHMCDDLLVVDKPSSIPVHPCGRYRYNSILYILAKEHNIHGLKSLHRLDKLTSGVLIFGRRNKKLSLIMEHFRNGMIEKEYLCRVDGNFPDGIVSCGEPIRYLDCGIGVCSPGPKRKDCSTNFKKLSYNGKTSLVLCKPKTGRTHQIRVHLQYLGHPISNDLLYNNEIYGKNDGKFPNYQRTDEELTKSYHKLWEDIYLHGFPIFDKGNSDRCARQQCLDASNKNSNFSEAIYPNFDPSKVTFDSTCHGCISKFADPRKENLLIYLHAAQYKGPDWMFKAPIPYWASDDFLL